MNTFLDDLKKPLSLAKIAIVATIYVVVSSFVPAFTAYQFRISESLNYLAIFNKRYILGVTLGVFITNLSSPYGFIDVAVGSATTFVALAVSYYLSRTTTNKPLQFLITAAVVSFFMFTIAIVIAVTSGTPFWANYIALLISEAGAMAIGAIIMYPLSERIDLTK